MPRPIARALCLAALGACLATACGTTPHDTVAAHSLADTAPAPPVARPAQVAVASTSQVAAGSKVAAGSQAAVASPAHAAVTPAPRAATTAPRTPAGAALLQRLAVIGASASYGINLRASLADALSALIAVPHEPPLDGALGNFSAASLAEREQLVRLALEREPSVVVAVDFLFWYVYGLVPEAQRVPRVQRALELLELFECPVVISLIEISAGHSYPRHGPRAAGSRRAR